MKKIVITLLAGLLSCFNATAQTDCTQSITNPSFEQEAQHLCTIHRQQEQGNHIALHRQCGLTRLSHLR